MNNMMKPKKMMGGVARIPQGYKDGGKVKPFAGKDNKKEERAEAKMVRSGKVSPAQYASKEKAEGDMKSSSSLMRTGKSLSSGAMTAMQYGSKAKK